MIKLDKITKTTKLQRNSIYLVMSTLLGSGSGFIFWIIAARFFRPYEVGLASTMISCANLIATLSIFGFNVSLVRYMHSLKNKNDLINTCMCVSIFAVVIISTLFILGSYIWAKSIEEKLHTWIYALIFVMLALSTVIVAYQRWGVFISNRSMRYYFYQTLVSFSRVVILLVVVFLGGLGIVLSYLLTNLFAILFGLYISVYKFKYRFRLFLNKEIIKIIFKYSLMNYLIDIFSRSFIFLPPLIISNAVGLKQTAYFYVAWIITVLVYTLIDNVSISLLAEGSYNEMETKKYVKQAIVFVYMFVIPSIIILNIGGYKILTIFGKPYITYSLKYLRILIISTLFYAFNSIFISVKRIEKNMLSALVAYIVISLPPLVFGYSFVSEMGINGFCVLVVSSNAICTTSILIYYLYLNILQ